MPPLPSTTTERAEPSDRALVEKLFLTHSGAIKGFIHALLRDRSLVEDVLQETFLVVAAKAASFKAGTNFVAWACTIARFKVLETIRKRARAESFFSAEVIEALAATAPTEEGRESTLAHLESCLRELSQGARRVIDLRYFQARPPDEIATLLSLTVDSVYVALSRSRRVLRMCVAGKLKQVG
ncbi:MAG: sigma-70 family RNA polymerase sigma factor [Opitutaceae bacterium]